MLFTNMPRTFTYTNAGTILFYPVQEQTNFTTNIYLCLHVVNTKNYYRSPNKVAASHAGHMPISTSIGAVPGQPAQNVHESRAKKPENSGLDRLQPSYATKS